MYFIKRDIDTDFPTTSQSSPTFTRLLSGNYITKAKTSCFEVVQPLTLLPASEIGDIIVGDNTYCTGSSLNLSTIALGPITSIVWTLPTNSTVSTPVLVIDNVSGANNGEYKVTVITLAGCAFNGSLAVTVNPNSEVAAPVFSSAAPAVLCQSNTTQFIDYNANSTNSSSISYTISPSQAGTIGTPSQPARVQWNPLFHGAATITALATGCGGDKSTNFVVTINPRSISTDIISDDKTICADQTAIILSAHAPTISSSSFTWYTSSMADGLELGTGDNFTVNPSITTTYYVEVTGNDICANEPINRKAVTVTVSPVATVSDIIASDETICEGETVTLLAASTLLNPVFIWYTDPLLNNSISNIETLSVNPSTTTTYYVTVEADGICTLPAPAKPVKVFVNPLPIAAITYPNGEFCNRGTASVIQTGTTGGNYISDTGLIINSTAGEINLASSIIGDHTITYTFDAGTGLSSTTTIITINATTLPASLPDINEECAVDVITAPTLIDPCVGTLTAHTAQSFPIAVQGETDVTWFFTYEDGYTLNVIQKVIINALLFLQFLLYQISLGNVR